MGTIVKMEKEVESDSNQPSSTVAEPVHTHMVYAALQGKTNVVKEYLANGIDPNSVNEYGWSVLNNALKGGNTDIVKLLVSKGADVNKLHYKWRSTPLQGLVFYRDDVALLDILLSLGAASSINHRDEEGYSALHIACKRQHVESAKTLIGRGANVALRSNNDKNESPLHVVVKRGNLELTRLIVNRLIALNQTQALFLQNNEGKSAFHLAAFHGNIDLLKFLLQSAPNNSVPCIIHEACKSGQEDVVTYLVEQDRQVIFQRDKSLREPLYFACKYGEPNIVKFLINNGGQTSSKDIKHKTCLHIAISKCCNDVVRYLIPRFAKMTKGLGLDVKTKRGKTPLHYACRDNNVKGARLLLESGAQLMEQDEDGNNSLHYVFLNDNPDILDVLLTKAPKIDVKNRDGLEPVDIAVMHSNFVLIMRLLKHPCCTLSLACLPDEALERFSMHTCLQEWNTVFNMCINTQRCAMSSKGSKVKKDDPWVNLRVSILQPRCINSDGIDDWEPELSCIYEISKSHMQLFNHPFISAVLEMKWHKIKSVYNCTWTFNVLHLSLLATYIFYLVREDFMASNALIESFSRNIWLLLSFIGLSITTIIKLFSQLLLVPINKWRTIFSVDGIIKILELISSIELLMNAYLDMDHFKEMASLAIMAGCFNCLLTSSLILLFDIGIYITIFQKITVRLLKMMCVFEIMLISFAIVFYLLDSLKNVSFISTFVNVNVMTSGSLDYQDANFQSQFFLDFIVYLFFVVFCTIALMNMMLGLAVSDTKEILAESRAYCQMVRLRFIILLEVFLITYRWIPFFKWLHNRIKLFSVKHGISIFSSVNKELITSHFQNVLKQRTLTKKSSRSSMKKQKMSASNVCRFFWNEITTAFHSYNACFIGRAHSVWGVQDGKGLHTLLNDLQRLDAGRYIAERSFSRNSVYSRLQGVFLSEETFTDLLYLSDENTKQERAENRMKSFEERLDLLSK